MKKRLFSFALVAIMALSSAITAFADETAVAKPTVELVEMEVLKEFTFDDATGLIGFTSAWLDDEMKYRLDGVEAPISNGKFTPNAEAGALVEGKYNLENGFRITAKVSMPATASVAPTLWCRAICTIIDVSECSTLHMNKLRENVDFRTYSLRSNGWGQGFQAHADISGGDDTWGGDGETVSMNTEHEVMMQVMPNDDGVTCSVVMTVDGEYYALPNLESQPGDENHVDRFPNYLSDRMMIMIGNTMYGDAYPYDILELKIERVHAEDPTTAEPTTRAPRTTTAKKTEEEQGGLNPMVLVGVGVVLAIGVVVAAVVVLKKKKAAPAEAVNVEEPKAEETENNEDNKEE